MVMVQNKKILGVIPARLKSQRFADKIIQKINNRALINYTYEKANQCSMFDDVIIAIDDNKIYESLDDQYKPAAMITSKHHPSGTDRIIEVMENKNEYDYYINIQGDEPLIPIHTIEGVIHVLQNEKTDISTAAIEITESKDYLNPNIVKVVFDNNQKALYFSRSPIPYDRSNDTLFKTIKPYKHIGIYGYTKNALAKIKSLKEEPLESSEKLEQLRFLSNGFAIKVFITNTDSIGVDTEEDFILVKKVLEKN